MDGRELGEPRLELLVCVKKSRAHGALADAENFRDVRVRHPPDLGELQKKINEAIQQLTPDHRAVVTMFDIQGMPHADIAKILRISEGTVRSRLFYAHKQLQAWLSEFAPVHSNSHSA